MLNTRPVDTDGNLAAIDAHLQAIDEAREIEEAKEERIADRQKEITEDVLGDSDETLLDDFYDAMGEDHPEIMRHLLTAVLRGVDRRGYTVIGDHAQAQCLPGIEVKARFLRNRLDEWAERIATIQEG